VSRPRSLFPYLSLTLFAFLAAEPLARAEMTCSDDGPFHLFRAVELGSLIQAGHFFPRWSPHMAQGYGYPFYNFYAPLSSYFVVFLHAFGLEYPAALKLAFGLAIWLAGLGAFLFVRDFAGERPALVAAIAYLFAPYFAYDILFRGNFAETLAFVWMPFTLWAIRRALCRATSNFPLGERPTSNFLPSGFGLEVWSLSFGIFSYAALILTHNIFALLASPLFAGYVALLAWQQRSFKTLWRGLLMLLAGILLAAYFWLPALAERNLVHSDRLLVAPVFTWYTNFITLADLLAPPHLPDPLLINPSPARALGLVPVLLCLPALLIFFTAKHTQSAEQRSLDFGIWDADAAFFLLALLAYALMTLSVSTPVWQLLKPLELVQFPWRMLGPASLCVAILIGLSVHALEQLLSRHAIPHTPYPIQNPHTSRLLSSSSFHLSSLFFLLPTSFILLLFSSNLAYWYPRYCPASPTATVADLLAYEKATVTIGTTAKGEYLPRTSAYVPADDSLAQALIHGDQPQYLTGLPSASQLQITHSDPLDYRAIITVPQESRLTFNQFFYPGWRVLLDNQPATIQLTPDTGLITVQVSSGVHTLRIYFGTTPLRAIAIVISLIALISLLGFGISRFLRLGFCARPPAPQRSERPRSPALVFGFWDLGFIALLLFLKLAFPDRLAASRLDLASQQLTGMQHPLAANLENNLHLYGYDLTTTTLAANSSLDAALYLGVTAFVPARYWPNFTLEDASGLNWLGDSYPPRWHRPPPDTYLWDPDSYAQWARHLAPFPGTPPGDYRLWASIFDLDTFHPQSILDESGQAIAPRFSLGTLTITRPSQPFTLTPEHPTPHDFGDLTLLGYNLDHDSANAGDTVLLTLYWKTNTAPQADYTARVVFLSPSGVPASTIDLPPVNLYPTREWQPDDQWRGQHFLRLPAALPSGNYQLQITLNTSSPVTSTLGPLTLTAPARAFTRPTIQHETDATLPNVASLEGYSILQSSTSLSLTLYWHATATPDNSYSVFIHLADDSGHVWAQDDSVPVHWTRPTTGWLPGEYVSDEHTLTLPTNLLQGNYHLLVGLYDPATNTRVPATGPGAQPDNRIELTAFTLP